MDRVWIGPPALVLVSTLAAFSSQTARAQEQLPDRFALKVGTYNIYDSDTNASVRSSTGALGTSLNFRNDLDGEKDAHAPWVEGYYRFNPHNRIDYGWYKFSRRGSKDLTKDITFLGETFTIGAVVNSKIEAELVKLAYTWSFYHSDKVELGASLGINYLSYSIQLSTSQGDHEEASFDTPLPMWGLRMDYSITPRWHVLTDFATFYVEVNNDLRGTLGSFQLATEYRIVPNFGLGAGLGRTTIDGRIDDGSFRGDLNDTYRGYQVYGALYF